VSAPIDPFTFRQLCGHFATGVAIVTALDAGGQPAGMTINSFASVSLDPPLVSFAIDHAATVFAELAQATHVTINILDAQHEALSRRFAAGLSERFDGVAWHLTAGGRVVLDGTLAQLYCERWHDLVAGDHTLFIGLVIGGAVAEHGRPLVHYRGGYGGIEA
jgi:flavin reductase (DIM6/NTAB) family NADH-FMN oxidoreductase RutF